MPTELTDDEKLAKIAEAMGWKWETPFNSRKKCNRLISPDYKHVCYVWKDGVHGGKQLQPYLTSADAALTLADALAKEGFECALFQYSQSRWNCVFTKGDISHYSASTTLPRAVGEAFAKVKGLW